MIIISYKNSKKITNKDIGPIFPKNTKQSQENLYLTPFPAYKVSLKYGQNPFSQILIAYQLKVINKKLKTCFEFCLRKRWSKKMEK